MEAASLSEALRTTQGLHMFCRRGIVLTSFVASLSMMVIGLHQIGLIRHLPDLPWRRLESSEVSAVEPAYRPLGLPIPDAFLGLISYAVTAALAAFGGPGREQQFPAIVLLMAAKIAGDAALAGVLWWIQWAWYRSFCMYCLMASIASFIAIPLAAPETWAALKRLF